MALGIAESGRKDPRRDCRDDTERIGGADAHGDQRKHVQAAVEDRFDAADEKCPARPKDDRRCQDELGPNRRTFADPSAHRQAHHGTHREHQERNRQRCPDPEAAREIHEFRIGSLVSGRHAHGLQRHAAAWAVSGPLLLDLRAHGTDVKRALGHRFRRGQTLQVSLGLPLEFFPATRRAEIEALAGVFGDMPGARSRHGHAADGVLGLKVIFRRRLELVAAPCAAEAIDVAFVLVAWLVRVRIDGHGADRISHDGRLMAFVLMAMRVGGHGPIPFRQRGFVDSHRFPTPCIPPGST